MRLVDYIIWFMVAVFTVLSIIQGANPILVAVLLLLLVSIRALIWWFRNGEVKETG